MPPTNKNNAGRSSNQRYKSLLTWRYLLKHSDENHRVTLQDIADYLEAYGILAERHSISRDIRELQSILDMENNMDGELDEQDKLGYEIEFKRGCRIVSRPYAFENLRLLAECVRSSKFICEGQQD